MIFCDHCDNVMQIHRVKARGETTRKLLHCTVCGHVMPFLEDKHKDAFMMVEYLIKTPRDKTLVLDTPLQHVLVTEEDREAIDLEDGCWDADLA